MQNKRLAVMSVIVCAAMIFTISMLYSHTDLQAFGGTTLNPADAAKTIQVRITPQGTINEKTFDSFSRIGFVAGGSNFLLESIPSKDKKPFYLLVKNSLADKNRNNKSNLLDISIDIFSGDGEVIETLAYDQCSVTEYFVHGIDSKGTILFLKDNDGSVEIREVTKFQCLSLTLDLGNYNKAFEILQKSINVTNSENFEIITEDPYFSRPPRDSDEGALFFNSNTNTLQKYVNGTWVNISGKGGPIIAK
jgi:hypothetical protein